MNAKLLKKKQGSAGLLAGCRVDLLVRAALQQNGRHTIPARIMALLYFGPWKTEQSGTQAEHPAVWATLR